MQRTTGPHSARVDENGEKEGDAARHARIKADIAAHVGASERMVQSYLADIDKDLREQRSARIFSLWMQCWTQAEIADTTGVPRQTITRKLEELPTKFPGTNRVKLSEYAEDGWTPPLFDIWNADRFTDRGDNLTPLPKTTAAIAAVDALAGATRY